jgi:hypothetical protein
MLLQGNSNLMLCPQSVCPDSIEDRDRRLGEHTTCEIIAMVQLRDDKTLALCSDKNRCPMLIFLF